MKPDFLASDDAITTLCKQIRICELMKDETIWPQISLEHGKELLKEIACWRKLAGLLGKDKE